jgi:hypothetical protein
MDNFLGVCRVCDSQEGVIVASMLQSGTFCVSIMGREIFSVFYTHDALEAP